MIISQIIGGLGNQMSQYAFGRYLSLKHNTELKIDITGYEWYKTQPYLLNNFNICAEEATKSEIQSLKSNRVLAKLGITKPSYVLERDMVFNKSYKDTKNNSYLEGAWGSELYFKEIEDTIRKDFTIKKPLDVTNKHIVHVIKNMSSAASVHFRRGDYVTDKEANKIHGTCSIEYYTKALDYIYDNINPQVCAVIFSDDIDWVKNNFHPNFPHIFIDTNDVYNGYKDMYLMSLCKHHIIANSSFSWWGAWLGTNPNKIVITPKKWFNADYNTSTLLPDGWITI